MVWGWRELPSKAMKDVNYWRRIPEYVSLSRIASDFWGGELLRFVTAIASASRVRYRLPGTYSIPLARPSHSILEVDGEARIPVGFALPADIDGNFFSVLNAVLERPKVQKAFEELDKAVAPARQKLKRKIEAGTAVRPTLVVTAHG